jgi:hypothetical protein
MNLKIFVTTIITTVFLFTGVAVAADYQATSKAGDFEVVLTIDKNPPVVGQNNATIAIKDGSGQPVTDASVRLEFGMPAMPGMPAMNYKADAVSNDGIYKTPLSFSMAGSWFINTKILRDKKIVTAKFNVDVQ